MQLSEKQQEQLVAVRRTLLREVGALISEWDQLWAELQVLILSLFCTAAPL